MQELKKSLKCLIGFWILLFSLPIKASCTLSTSGSGCAFQLQAVIQNGCLIQGGPGTAKLGSINFGSYPSLSPSTSVTTSLQGSTVFSLNCTPNMSFNMSIDGGQNFSNGRQLSKDLNRLPYQLFSDSAMQNPINVNQPISIFVGTNNNINIILPVYAKLTLSGNTRAGIYKDTLTITLSW